MPVINVPANPVPAPPAVSAGSGLQAPVQARVLLLPGWLNSGAGHWQTRWEALYSDERVQQADWLWPRRGDWMARLDDVVQASETPTLLVAYSLGCHLVAAWAAHSQRTARVRGALLVAPPDLAQAELPPQVQRWAPPVLQPLPFAATCLFSEDDPCCSAAAALAMARAWGAVAHPQGARGHLSGDAGLGDWPEARLALQALATGAGLVLPQG